MTAQSSQAAVRRQLGLPPDPALDAAIIAPPSLAEHGPKLIVRQIARLKPSVPGLPCEDCGGQVTLGWALAGLAELGMVLCDDCRLETRRLHRESLLTDHERAVRDAWRRLGNKSAVARELGISRFAVARTLKRIDRKLECGN